MRGSSRSSPRCASARGMENFGAHMQKFVEGSPEAQDRVKRFQQRFAAMQAETAAQHA